MPRTFLAVVVTAALYLATGAVEWLLAAPIPHRTTGWWPCGVGVAAVWLVGRRAAPGVFLGELAYVAGFTIAPVWGGLVTGLGNTAEVMLAVALLRRLGYRPELDRPRDVLALLAAAGVSPLAMITFQVPMSLATGWPTDGAGLGRTAGCWLANDAVGIAYVVPLLATLARLRAGPRPTRPEAAEAGLLLLGLAAAGLGFGLAGDHWLPGLTAVAFPFLAWSALRFGPPLTAVALGAYAGCIALVVARGWDPFPIDHWSGSFPALHLLLGAVAGTGLLLAACTAARRAAERRALDAARWEGLGLLAAGLAHEFNNRLTEVIGFVELAAGRLPPSDPTARQLALAGESAKRMAERTRQVRAAAGHALGPARPVDLGAVVRELAADLPVTVGPGDLTVSADPDLVRLALGHVLANAREAAGAAVAVSVERDGGWVRVRVADRGPGMAAAVADKAFDLFFSTKFPGRGLGLPVARGVLAQAGGTATLETVPGAGTTVELGWPVA